VDSDREPDEAEEKVEHDNKERETKHCLVPPRREVINRDRYNQHRLGDSPDERPPFDVIVADPTRKVNLPYGKLRDDVIRRPLGHTVSEETKKVPFRPRRARAMVAIPDSFRP
jgi:hypothetical protein